MQASIAWFKYGRGPVADTAPTNVSVFTRIARRDLLQDDFNESVFMRPGQALTRLIVKTDDVVVDGTVRGVAAATLGSGSALRSSQTGFVRSYAALIVIGAIALIAAIWAVTFHNELWLTFIDVLCHLVGAAVVSTFYHKANEKARKASCFQDHNCRIAAVATIGMTIKF